MKCHNPKCNAELKESDKVCRKCGAPWGREVKIERAQEPESGFGLRGAVDEGGHAAGRPGRKFFGVVRSETVGWHPSCRCRAGQPVPCTVLDPFSGTGTTGAVARALGRNYVGIDLNPDYLPEAESKILSACIGARRATK